MPGASSRPYFASFTSMSWTISAIARSAGSASPNRWTSTSNVQSSLAFVRELRLEHVEAQLALLGLVALRRHELEARLRVDELADEPGARHPVHLDPGARDPRASTVLRDIQRRLRRLTSLDGPHPYLHSGQQALDDLAPGCSEEVDRRELGRAPPHASELLGEIRAPRVG